MSTLPEEPAGYHSFVVRVFVDWSSRIDHGQITHVGSRRQASFASLDDAPRLMGLLLDALPEEPAATVSRGETSTTELVPARRAPPQITYLRPPSSALAPVSPYASSRVQRRLKRVMDVVVALAALLVASPVMAMIAVAIKLESAGPLVHRQQRAAAGGRVFTMYKFRSMRADADDLLPELRGRNEQRFPLFKIRDDPRKTRVGRVLRRLSLDELPQLVNVLKGDISLIGPRPPLASEVAAYEPEHWQRLAMPQGMTGLWQVSGRSLLDFDEMLRLDLRYIASWSLASDIRILLRTVPTVLSGRGAF